MTKIVKNTTQSSYEIPDTGILIAASSQYTIPPVDYLLWAESSDTQTGINSGDLVINNGFVDLSIARGLDYIKYPDNAFSTSFLPDSERGNSFISNNVQEAIEEARDVALNVRGKLVDFEYSSQGNTQNKWASVAHPSQTSDSSPFVANWDGVVVGLTFSNDNNFADCDIELYVNQVITYTWQGRNKRTAWIAQVDENNPLFTITQGDKISIFIKKVSGGTGINPANINGSAEVMLTAMGDGSGGTASGV